MRGSSTPSPGAGQEAPVGRGTWRGYRRIPRVLQGILLLMFVVFAITTIPGVRSTPAFSVGWDGWWQGTAYVVMATLAILQPLARREHRLVCLLLAVAITLRVLAFLVYWTYVRQQNPPPYPSAADAGWLLMCVVLLVALGARVRDHAPLVSLPLLLDAVVGALLTAGLATVLLYPTLSRLSRAGTPPRAVAVNLAYPVLDVALLIASVGLLTVVRWRPSPPEALLVAGVVLLAVDDTVYLFKTSEGTFHPGTWVSSLAFLATALIASAGWTPGGFDRPVRPEVERKPSLVTTFVLAVVGIVVLVYAGALHLADLYVPGAAFLLVGLAVVLAVARGVVTVLQERRLLGTATEEMLRFQALVEASNDFIAIAGMDGQVRYVNPAGRAMVGLEPDRDVSSTTIMDYLTEEGQRASMEIEQPAVVAHGHWEGESTLKDAVGGRGIPVAINSFLMLHPGTGQPFALATVQRDIRDRIRAQSALQDLADQRQRLLDRLVEAQEDERARIAEDVHDDSVQALAAVDLRLGLLRRQLVGSPPDLLETVDKTHRAVAAATDRLRHLLFDLESPAQDTDLAGALERAAEHAFEDSPVRWQVTGDREVDLVEGNRVTAYRIAKEAMVNVRKHADATRLDVRLATEGDGVLITIADDGSGFAEPEAARRGHLGLSSMRDRAEIAGGRLEVESSADGTVVRLWLPHHHGGSQPT